MYGYHDKAEVHFFPSTVSHEPFDRLISTTFLSDTVTAVRWMDVISLTSGLWAARMSMITAIIRITSPQVQFRRYAYAAAVTFGMMWVAMLIQKLYIRGARTALSTTNQCCDLVNKSTVCDSLK
ncbi:hypothetical protein OG21DRAFT_1518182 [Imleria badia]|nr:hypothetical protein OG21DRAFT_1518182 [Imleria badia]